MSNVVFDISMSMDGFIAADNRTAQEPLGKDGERLHGWLFGNDERDRAVLTDGMAATGAVIAGRRTYEESLPWWGADGPTGPARLPVVVVSHSAPDNRSGDGVYHFVEGIHDALALATTLANGKGVTVMGGAETGRQFLAAGLVDELSLHLVPVLFGRGLRFFEDADAGHATLEPLSAIHTPHATHLRLRVAR